MGMTMTQKILAAHAGLDSVVAGQLIEAKLDVVMANDITGPMACLLYTSLFVLALFGIQDAGAGFILGIAVILWFTVLLSLIHI